MTIQNETVDLSSLRISRSRQPNPGGRKSSLMVKIAVGLGVMVLLFAGYRVVSGLLDPVPEVQLTTVSLTSPSQARSILTASGYIVAQRKAAVASKATGRLEYLGVVEGDRVRKGEVIARIENSDIKAQLDEATANLRLSEAELNDAEQNLARQRSLLEKGLTTQAEFDAAEARHRRVLASIGVAKAMVAGAEVALENTLIRAPFDGTVLTKNADVGEMVAPMAAGAGSRAAVVTIADMSSLEAEADVSESNIERIRPDLACEITLDAYPETRYRGFVSKIVPTADRAKATVMVKVGFRSYDSKVLPEMSAKVLFLAEPPTSEEAESHAMLTVPAQAVASRDGRSVVYAVNDNRATEIPVTLGKTVGSLVAVSSGLKAGDRIVARVSDAITDGATVRVK